MSEKDKEAGRAEAERKLRLLGDRLRVAAKHVDQLNLKPEVKAALREQFPTDKEELRFEAFFREFIIVFRMPQHMIWGHFEPEISVSAEDVKSAISGMKKALGATKTKKVVIPEKLISYCTQRLLVGDRPVVRSRSENEKAKLRIETAVRESLARLFN